MAAPTGRTTRSRGRRLEADGGAHLQVESDYDGGWAFSADTSGSATVTATEPAFFDGDPATKYTDKVADRPVGHGERLRVDGRPARDRGTRTSDAELPVRVANGGCVSRCRCRVVVFGVAVDGLHSDGPCFVVDGAVVEGADQDAVVESGL